MSRDCVAQRESYQTWVLLIVLVNLTFGPGMVAESAGLGLAGLDDQLGRGYIKDAFYVGWAAICRRAGLSSIKFEIVIVG